jgi:FKBP-type peptidyl-prolyl cis-trans isomerase
MFLMQALKLVQRSISKLAFFTACFLPFFTVARPVSDGDTVSVERFLTEKKVKAIRVREGVFVSLHTEGVGKLPQKGDFIRLHYVGKLLNGRVFDATPRNEPFAFQIGSQQVVEGLDIALATLHIGAKATVFLDAPMAYGSLGIGDVIPPNTPISYEVEVKELLTKNQYDATMHDMDDKMRRDFIERMAIQFEKEKHWIQDYALLHRIRSKRTESGISYAITKQGTADSIKMGSEVSFHFEARLLNDQLFDSTKERGATTVTMGDNQIIAGLEEGLRLFTKGSEGYLLIPSKFGYGTTPIADGTRVVPGNSVLIFKISIVEVKQPEVK